MSAFWPALLFITLAEMGDKTQLVSLALATRFSARTVLAGIFVATLLVHLFSAGAGEVVGLVFPPRWTALAAGIAFIGFGLWTLRDEKWRDERPPDQGRFGPFLTVVGTFFLAELGDKTMLATATLAGRYHAFVPVWLGSTFGMVLADGIAILVTAVAGRRLPERAVRSGAAAIFILSGVVTISEALF